MLNSSQRTGSKWFPVANSTERGSKESPSCYNSFIQNQILIVKELTDVLSIYCIVFLYYPVS